MWISQPCFPLLVYPLMDTFLDLPGRSPLLGACLSGSLPSSRATESDKHEVRRQRFPPAPIPSEAAA